MSNELPRQIEVQPWLDGIRYRLPPRQLDRARWAGLVPMVFGVMFSGFAVFWMIGAAQSIHSPNGQFQWFGVAFTLSGLPFFFVGLVPIGFGLAIMFGNSEIEISRGSIRAIERIGPLRWTRKRPIDAITRLLVVGTVERTSSESSGSVPIGSKVIRAEFNNRKSLWLAMAYPLDLLTPLADDISSKIEALGYSAAVEIPLITTADDNYARVDRRITESLKQPDNSKVQLKHSDMGITLTIPPVGIWRGSKGLFGFSLFWCGFMIMFTAIAIVAPLMGATQPNPNIWIFSIFCAVFWAVGIGVMLCAINMGRRHAIIDIVDDTLLINRKNLFGFKQHEWTRDQLQDIRIGPSGMTVNNVEVMELQIHPTTGEKLGLFSGRDKQELKWMADVLSRQLEL